MPQILKAIDYSIQCPKPDNVFADVYASYAEWEDTDILPQSELELSPRIIHVGSIPEMAELLQQLTCGRDFIDSTLQHEQNHGLAVQGIPQTSLQYGVELQGKVIDGVMQVGINANTGYTGALTKLQHASIAAHPANPSRGDKNMIAALGYSDRAEIALRTKSNNDQGWPFAPIPLT